MKAVPSTSSKSSHAGRFARFLLCTAAGGVLAADVAAANVLVIRSAGPSATTYKPGKALPNDARVLLRQGDVVVLLASDSTRTLRGPGNFALASAAAPSGPQTSSVRRGRFSALRSAGIIPRSPTLWHVDVSQSGKFCLADKSNVMLWRPSAAEAVTLTVAGAGGPAQTASWPAGQTTLAWPSSIPVTSGTEYQLSWPGNATPTKLTFATLPTVPTDITSVAQSLIEQKCENQLELLIQTVPSQGMGTD
jgi:hypothetical protein